MSSHNNNSNNECLNQNLEAKRRQNIEDNRRFLAALKINDIRDEIKEITTSNNNQCNTENVSSNGRRVMKKELQSDIIRRSSRIRQNIDHIENLPPKEHKQKKKITKNTDENRTDSMPKVKLQLPSHMLIRYQSSGKKVALHNTKAKFGDDGNESLLM
ncbi:unnamed protein product [Adineta steineri]|uniref:Uncharacterized protein n=1 Tax=Adineta steineri TaxID=433720 RepID=A0A818MDL4_9BILA|nr:unnamed protein product [Adineta steineri]CAF3587799.1 unnamed protein product [Adineta steineri]